MLDRVPGCWGQVDQVKGGQVSGVVEKHLISYHLARVNGTLC